MNWSDERYVRVFTRDTADWLSLSFIAQGLFALILRKVDRAGVMQLGRHGKRGVAITIGHPGDWSRLESGLEELLADGCVVIKGEHLIVPNFMEAQEAAMSDAQRQRESREKRLAKSMAEEVGLVTVVTPVTGRDIPSQNVTTCHETGGIVTACHTPSQPVTPSVPSRAEPAVLPMHAGRARVKIGPLGSELRLLVEQGLGHGLIPCSQPEADELEGLIESFGGVDPAKDFVASTCRKRSTDPQSMAWVVTVLRPSVSSEVRS
jgi:hypothetical protein